MEKNLKAIKITTIVACVIIFACIIVLTIQFIKIGNLKEKNRNLETYRAELMADINDFDTANDYYNNNRTEYLESYAREVLGWGANGETWYRKG